MEVKWFIGSKSFNTKESELPRVGAIVYLYDYGHPRQVIGAGHLTSKKFRVKNAYHRLVLGTTKPIKDFQTEAKDAEGRFREIVAQIEDFAHGHTFCGLTEDGTALTTARHEGEAILEEVLDDEDDI